MTTRKVTYGCNEGVKVYRQSVAATNSYLNTYLDTYLNTYLNTYLSVRHSFLTLPDQLISMIHLKYI